jgi:cell division septum initiation protein DivIVA
MTTESPITPTESRLLRDARALIKAKGLSVLARECGVKPDVLRRKTPCLELLAATYEDSISRYEATLSESVRENEEREEREDEVPAGPRLASETPTDTKAAEPAIPFVVANHAADPSSASDDWVGSGKDLPTFQRDKYVDRNAPPPVETQTITHVSPEQQADDMMKEAQKNANRLAQERQAREAAERAAQPKGPNWTQDDKSFGQQVRQVEGLPVVPDPRGNWSDPMKKKPRTGPHIVREVRK